MLRKVTHCPNTDGKPRYAYIEVDFELANFTTFENRSDLPGKWVQRARDGILEVLAEHSLGFTRRIVLARGKCHPVDSTDYAFWSAGLSAAYAEIREAMEEEKRREEIRDTKEAEARGMVLG